MHVGLTRRTALILLPLLLAAGVWLVARHASADSGDDTLKRWMDRSDVVVDATLRSFGGAFYNEIGVANYAVELEVHATLKGKPLALPPAEAVPKDQPARPRALIVRFELVEEDRLPYLKEGARVVLFLHKQLPTGNFPAHRTSDFWFGVQPHGPWLVRRLTELAKVGR